MSLYLYHATDSRNIDSIKKKGLLKNPGKHNWEGMYLDDGVYLAFDADVAESYAETSDAEPEEIVILKISLDNLDQDYIEYDWNNKCEYKDEINSCVYRKDIPPSCIEVTSSENEPAQDIDDFEGTDMYENILQTFDEEVETNKEIEESYIMNKNYNGGSRPNMKLRIMESVNLDDGYEEVSSRNGYRIYRKTLRDDNGKIIKGIWAAQDWDGKGEPFEITYDQATGYEPINTQLGNLQKKVSKALGFGRYRDIEESMGSERIVARSFEELIEKLQDLGYHTGPYNDDHMPSDNWLYIGKNHKEYEAEFTVYSDGRYELMLYNIKPTGEDYDLDIDEGCHKKSSKNKKRKVVKEDLYQDAQKEVYNFFMKKQWDLNIPEVANYAESVAEYLELDPEFATGEYTMRDWYKDTQINYPEEIEWLDSTAY